MSKDHPDGRETPMPLAFNTRNGVALEHLGVFRDAEGNWWSVQARKPSDLVVHARVKLPPSHSHLQDDRGRAGHISFVRLSARPHWLTEKDVSNLRVALELNQMLYKGNVKTFRTQDEADESFKEAHVGRELVIR